MKYEKVIGPRLEKYPLSDFESVYVSKELSRTLFGKIDIVGAEKSFAAAKCCMCCR